MDSISQAALGGAVGHAVLGSRAGRKAAIWGAAVATLPDLDVFVPLGNDLLEFTAHRSASHALPVLALATPALAWAIGRIHRVPAADRRRWLWLVGLCLWTHVFLDAFTVYGTQLLWPLWNYPFAWSTIFIVDPAYTVPLLIGLAAALRRASRFHWNTAGLVVSSAYLLWTAAAQWHVDGRARASLDELGPAVTAVLTTPAPFNSLLWRVLAMEPDGDYLEGYHSLVDGGGPRVAFRSHDGEAELLEPLDDTWAVQRLRWFTHGFYAARRVGERIVVDDLRMGFEPLYVFSFAVGEVDGDGVRALDGEQLPGPAGRLEHLTWVWDRLWNAEAGLAPPP